MLSFRNKTSFKLINKSHYKVFKNEIYILTCYKYDKNFPKLSKKIKSAI